MKMTVGIVHYNQPEYLERALSSVRRQTYSDIECLVADDCSPQTPDVGDARLFVSEQNTGNALWGWNKLIEEATGDYLFLLSADDELLPTGIADLADCAEKRGGDWLYGGIEVIDSNGSTLDMWDYATAPTETIRALAMLYMRHALPIPFIAAWRLDWLRENGLHCVAFPGVKESADTATGIDWLARWPRIRRIPTPVARYRRYEGQETGKIDREKLAAEIELKYLSMFDGETLSLFRTATRG